MSYKVTKSDIKCLVQNKNMHWIWRRSCKDVSSEERIARGKVGVFARWKGAAAVFALFAFTAPYVSSSRPVPFKSAAKRPELRQLYLDEMQKESKCIERIVYDHTGKKYAKANLGMIRELEKRGFGQIASEKRSEEKYAGNYCRAGTLARVAADIPDIGDGKKHTVFVCPALFGNSEEFVESIIRIHEERHACDIMDGLRIGRKRLAYTELLKADQRMLSFVLELRAFGDELQKAGGRKCSVFSKEYAFYLIYHQLVVSEAGKPQSNEAYRELDKPLDALLAGIRKRFGEKSTKDDISLFLARASLIEYSQTYADLMKKDCFLKSINSKKPKTGN